MDRMTPVQSEIDLSGEPSFKLAGLQVDPAAHESRYGGSSERLQPQPLKVLIALAQRRGDVVQRSDLVARCWGGRIVGDDVINRAILTLRGLGRRSAAFSIETVPKAGYRLIEGQGGDTAAMPRWLLPVIFLLLAGLGMVALLIFGQKSPSGKPPITIAVLPADSSDDPTARSLSIAVRNSLLHMLGDSGMPAQAATGLEQAKDADFILTSDVRRQEDTVTVTLHFEQSSDRTVLLSKVFRANAGALDGLADQVGAYAAANLSWPATYRILDQTADPALKAELLKQLFLTVEGGDLMRAYEMSERLAARAPDSAMAQLGLAHNAGFILDQLPPEQRPAAINRARAAAKRAQQAAPNFGDVYTPMCLLYPTAWQAFCEDYLLLALRKDPQAPYAPAYLRRYLGEVGRNREAVRYARMSLANDPYKPGKLGGLIGRLEALGETDEAAMLFASAVRWWPNYRVLYLERMNGMAERGDLAAVASFARQAPAGMVPVEPERTELLASGNAAAVKAACAGVVQQNPMGPLCLIALTKAGDLDEASRIARILYPPRVAATREAEDAIYVRDPVRVPTAFLASPALVAMRRDTHFLPLADSLGLVRYWRSGRLPDFCSSNPEPVCANLRSKD